MTVTKKDLVDQMAKELDITKALAGKAVNSLIDSIKNSISKGKDVQLTGFGTFTTSKRKARTGRNPQNGKSIKIPAKVVPKFRPGKDLKEAVGKKKAKKKR